MADRLALAQTAPPAAATVTPDEVEIIKSTIAPNATAAELKLFFYDCQRQGVHPLDRKIHFTKRGNKYSPITSIDFLRERAVDSGEYAGNDDPVFASTPKSATFTASVTVYRIVQGARYPFTATARWSEYLPDQAFMWNKMPHTMLGKCAEALALRKAFPKQLTGLYVREEMEQAEPAKAIPPESARTDSVRPGAGGPAPAEPVGVVAPADLNSVPESWRAFVQPDRLQGRIVAVEQEMKHGRKSGAPFTKSSITLDTGEIVTTLDHDLAATALACKAEACAVEISTKETRWGKDIVTIARLPEAESDDAF